MNNKPVGYITCLLHRLQPESEHIEYGDIDLVAVTPAARGRGVALALVRRALAWFAGCTDEVIVKTQVTNYPAVALYNRAGFVLKQAFQTMHLSIRL
jgi:ribosomal protein S18 acetylase RimI-like enzyme